MRTTSALFSLFLPPLVSDSRLFDAGLPEEHRYAVFSGSRLPEVPYSFTYSTMSMDLADPVSSGSTVGFLSSQLQLRSSLWCRSQSL